MKDLLNLNVILKVPDDELHTWVSAAVIAPKPSPKNIRSCIEVLTCIWQMGWAWGLQGEH